MRLPDCLALLVLAAGCGSPSAALDSSTLDSSTVDSSGLDSLGPRDLAAAADAAGTSDLAGTSMCTAAVEQLLMPIDQVSTGVVKTLSDSGGVKTLYLDASAGGISVAGQNPRLYLNLATGTRVALTDGAARKSTEWDLALKRVVLFTNDADGGPGTGGSLALAKSFDEVTAKDAVGTNMVTEAFVDDMCNAMLDPIGEVLTSMSHWYDYDQQTNIVTPRPVTTWLLRGATGKLYKLEIDDYYSAPDGTKGMSGGHFKIRIAAL